MLIQIAVGAFVIAVTIVIHGSMLGVARIAYRSNEGRKQAELSRMRAIMVLIGVIYWLLIAHLLEITIWALTFWTVDALNTFEESVYFAMVTSTALGYGDITLDVDWRITGALSSASGLILYGWSTAYLFEYMRYQRVSVAGLPEATID